MDADILSIGSEVVSGAIENSNATWLARRLADLGVNARRHIAVGDRLETIRCEIEQSLGETDAVIITGGLGPTPDDLTRAAIAEAIDQPLEHNDECAAHIRRMFERMQRPMADLNLQQALVPRTAAPLENPWGTAPGIRVEVGGTVMYALPGVPREMREMFARHVAPDLRERRRGGAIATCVLHTFGEGESTISARILDLMRAGRNPAVGTQASEGLISIRITAQADSDDAARRLVESDAERVRGALGSLVFGEGTDTLPSVLGEMLRARRQTLATAESCTGGLIAESLTDVPGSSDYFKRGYVAYSNDAKQDLLGVPASELEAHGAVSEPVARSMADGCRVRTGADYALAVTGIAGPGGGTPDKPVGLVFLGLARADGTRVQRIQLSDHLNRSAIRDRSCKTALNLLRLLLLEQGDRAT